MPLTCDNPCMDIKQPHRACAFHGNDTGGKPCNRLAVRGWTTCGRHYSAGRSTKQGGK